MDWGYESETGHVWLFNVTPFTPHLPHWRLWLRVCGDATLSFLASTMLTVL